MPMLIKPKLLIRKVDYLLEDRFEFGKAAGSVNGTRSTSGHLRTVVDTNPAPLLSIAGGVLTFAGGKAIPAYGDPGNWWPAQARVAGKVMVGTVTGGNLCQIGFGTAQSGTLRSGMRIGGTGLNVIETAVTGPVIATIAAATRYKYFIIPRATGMFLLIKGGAFTNNILLFISGVDSDATLYPGIANYSAVFTADDILIPAQLWLPGPSASDSFTRADGVLGTTDGLTGEQNGGSGLTWNFDTGIATIATNKAVITPTLGSELATGNLVVGTWYSITATQTDYFYTGSAIGDTFRAAATTALDANNKVKAITLSSMFATVSVGTANVKVRAKVAAFTAKTQAGVAIINNAVTPTQGVIFDFDGAGNCKIAEFTTATTWNALATAVKAFTASDELELSLDNDTKAYRCYHITSSGTATLIASGTYTATLGNNAGIFSAFASNTFSSFQCYARGNEGQYSILNTLAT